MAMLATCTLHCELPEPTTCTEFNALLHVVLLCCWLTQEVVVGVPLVLPGEPAVADMIQILQPFKV